MDRQAIDAILEKHGYSHASTIAILQDMQALDNYLPEEALRYISEQLEMSAARIYEIATFYKGFSLEPRGRHMIKVCCGTACHLGGAVQNVDQIKRELDFDEIGNTTDMEFTLEPVNCLGICALAPVVAVDEDYYDGVTPDKISRILSRYGGGTKDAEDGYVEED
ncbi:hypothetical protein LCGC14_2813930 [marine sediment metagenome]|uniref:Uncharacterized protein n=1 Tax=marine sediment metagenome TaxID=412755 RepID=A0A0F9BAG0_9ZZZZ